MKVLRLSPCSLSFDMQNSHARGEEEDEEEEEVLIIMPVIFS
jgi:hypothetical protein